MIDQLNIIRIEFDSAKRHFEMSAKLFEMSNLTEDSFESYQAKMGLMHAMQSGYTSIENGLKLILNVFDESLTVSDVADLDLLKRVAKSVDQRPAVISENTYQLANKVRKFKLSAMYRYDDFDLKESESAINAAEALAIVMIEEFNLFEAKLKESKITS